MSRMHADSTWPQVGERPLVMVPVGSIEQHGPHLPLNTDTTIASAVAASVVSHLVGEDVVAPAIGYGSSGEHQSFPGTVSIGTAALRLVLVELTRSVSTWAGRVVLVNGHGGNVPALRAAVGQLIAEGHHVGWLPCTTEGGDLHAGRIETSLMLHLRPDVVHPELAELGDTRPLTQILPLLTTGGVASVSPNGVLGDPTAATAEHGREVFGQMVADALERLRHGTPDAHGMLTRVSSGAPA